MAVKCEPFCEDGTINVIVLVYKVKSKNGHKAIWLTSTISTRSFPVQDACSRCEVNFVEGLDCGCIGTAETVVVAVTSDWYSSVIVPDSSAGMSSDPWLSVRGTVVDDRSEENDGIQGSVLLSALTARGIKNENRLPLPTSESTRSWPPRRSTIRATNASPSPIAVHELIVNRVSQKKNLTDTSGTFGHGLRRFDLLKLTENTLQFVRSDSMPCICYNYLDSSFLYVIGSIQLA